MTPKLCCRQPMYMVEIRGVYDGALYYECAVCGNRAHRFPESHPLHEKAKPFVTGGAA